ncbi:MAG: AAA family ATPase [Anaerolineaceae bacterium]
MIPIKLSLAGFTSYREPVEIDFTELDLVCISGPNGAGKSSLLDAITYALYGQARKRDEGIINNACQKAEVTLIFGYGGQIYRVTRSITRGKGSQVDFFIQKNQSEKADPLWKVLSQRTLSETNALIERTLRLDYETFINASFFLQGKADSFATQKPADRKRILGSILGLDQWELYRARTNELIKEKQTDVRLRDSDLAQAQAELDQEDQFKAHLVLVQERLKTASAQVAEAQATLVAQRAVEQQVSGQRNLLNMLARQVENAQKNQAETIQSLDEKQSQLNENRAELARADEIRARYQDYLALRQKLAEVDRLANTVQPLETRKQELQKQLHGRREALMQEMKYLESEKAALDLEIIKASELEMQLAQLDQEITVLQAHISQKEALEIETQALQSQIAEKQANNDVIEQKGKEIGERLDKIMKVEGAACPLCGQPLAIHDRQRLEAELSEEKAKLANQYKANRDAIKEIAQRQKTLSDERLEIQRQEKTLQNLTRESDRLKNLLQQLEMQQANWQRAKAPQLEKVHSDLRDEIFLPEVRAELAGIEETLVQLGYDRSVHIQLREQTEQAQTAQAVHNHLEIASKTVEQIEQAVKELEARLKKQEQESDRLMEEHQNAAARLAEAQAGLPESHVTEQYLTQLQEDQAELVRQEGAAEQNLHNLERQRERKARLKAEKEALNIEIGRLRILERSFGKDGVPAMLIEQALPELQNQANDILARLSNYTMSVHFATQRSYKDAKRDDKKETLDILISDGASNRDYETFSGGEAFRVNFAIRLALSRVLAQRAGAQLRTLVIDEGFGNQDAEGRSRLIEAINLVKGDFDKILIITHIEELKDEFPARIEVEKGINGSKVTVIRA